MLEKTSLNRDLNFLYFLYTDRGRKNEKVTLIFPLSTQAFVWGSTQEAEISPDNGNISGDDDDASLVPLSFLIAGVNV